MGVISGVMVLTAILVHVLGDCIVSGWLLSPSDSPSSEYKGRTSYPEEHHLPMVSALGDPGMRSGKVRVAVEGWNFCNRAGNESALDGSGMLTKEAMAKSSSPRWADCTDMQCKQDPSGQSCKTEKKVKKSDNELAPGESFPGGGFESYENPDLYAIEKEKYLGALCALDSEPHTWSFWMIMLKNGNFDQSSGLCPVAMQKSNASTDTNDYILANLQNSSSGSRPTRELLFDRKSGFPCFGPGCMNQPLVYHKESKPQLVKGNSRFDSKSQQEDLALAGEFSGTYDLEDDDEDETDRKRDYNSSSFFSVKWYKEKAGGSWNFHHLLKVSEKYPWLMLYLRADATSGPSGGYPWATRGMMYEVPKSPHFKVVLTLEVIKGGGPASQFYLLDIGGCWKNDGRQCDGDLATDVTRYSEMIINPDTPAWCQPSSLHLCPPFHTTVDGKKIHRNDTQNYPYAAYHLYCVPYNALHAEPPYDVCDPYSNPQAQELVQLLPHPEWAVHGYPTSKGEGWIGDARTWELDVGALSSRLFFYQDPDTEPAVRKWPSIDVGTEVYISREPETAEWIVADFDVLVPSA